MMKRKKISAPARVLKNTTKSSGKKITRRKRKLALSPVEEGVLDIDQVYKAINRIQLNREPASILIGENDTFVVENILRDLSLPFKRKKGKASSVFVEYSISPAKEQPKTDHLDDIEEFPDEIIEEGQVFF